MFRTLSIAALAAISLTGTAFAMSAAHPKIVAPPPAPGQPAPQFYVDLLGGGSLASTLYYYHPGTSTLSGTDAVPMSLAGALAVGYGSNIPNLSFEGDFFYTNRPLDGGIIDLTTASIMGVAKYTLPLSDTFSVFGAVGVGGLYHHDHSDNNTPDSTNAWVAGYQLQGGVTAKVAENIRLVGEVRVENSFGHVPGLPGADDEQAQTTAVLIGARFGF